jgi:hypothetical protein
VLFENRQHPRLIGFAIEGLRDQALQLRGRGQDHRRLSGIVAVHRVYAAEEVFHIVSGDTHRAPFYFENAIRTTPKRRVVFLAYSARPDLRKLSRQCQG